MGFTSRVQLSSAGPLLAWAAAFVSPAPGYAAPPARQINAFCISKDTNSNTVCYDAKLTPDCRFAPDEPVTVHWAIVDADGGSHREGLGFFEKGVYGLDVKAAGPASVTAEVKALQKRGLSLPVRITAERAGDACVVRAYVRGSQVPRELQVMSIRLQDFHGLAPRELALQGKDASTRAPLRYTVHLG